MSPAKDKQAMPKVTFNKTSLKKERDQLTLYRQFLPSLDMKRQQLLQEQKKARGQVQRTEEEMATLHKAAEQWLPFLADKTITAAGIVKVEKVLLGEENIVGLTLPALEEVTVTVVPYSTLTTPLWFDSLVALLTSCAKLSVRLQVEKKRLALLAEALQTITKRVNLFDRVLIPDTRQNIRRIRIALADMERAGVIRAKLAKEKKHTGRD